MKIYSRKGIIYLDYLVDGKRHRKSTKLPDTKANFTLVKKEVVPQLQASIVRGEYQEATKQIVTILGDFGYRSLDLHRHERDKQVNTAYLQNFEMHILPYFKNELIKNITPIQLQEWQNTIVDKTSAASLTKYRNIFRQIFTDAILAGYIDSNPFDKIKRPKVEDVEVIPFTKDEIEKILNLASNKMQYFFTIAIFTGMRTGEQIALEWKDIDFAHKTISITKTRNRGVTKAPKTKSSIRVIDMLPIVEEYLHRQFEFTGHQEYVFLSSAKKLYYSSDIINVSLQKILKRLNISGRVLYNARHTFASLMLSNNESIMWVSKTLGHKNANITFERYARYIKEDKQNRAKFIEKWHIFGTQENRTRLKHVNKGAKGAD